MSELARVLLDDLAGDPAALERLRELAERPAPTTTLDATIDRCAVVRVPALLTVSATARLLGVSAKTVRRRIAAGELPAVVEHGRTMVRGDELRAYVEGLDRAGAPRPSRRRRATPRRDYGFLRE